MWKKNEPFDINCQNKGNKYIQEEEKELSSGYASERGEKNSQTKSLASQGKHPVSDQSMLPLGKIKDRKIMVKN